MATNKSLRQYKKPIAINQRGAGLIYSIVSLVFGFIIAVLAFRFFFRLLGASPDSAFVNWIYNVSQPLDAPFLGMFNNSSVLSVGRVEFETLIAIVVYGVIAALVLGALSWGGRRHHTV